MGSKLEEWRLAKALNWTCDESSQPDRSSVNLKMEAHFRSISSSDHGNFCQLVKINVRKREYHCSHVLKQTFP